MSGVHDPLKELTEIRSMMERSSKFLSLSGLSGVSAGLIALAGAYIADRILTDSSIAAAERVKYISIDAISVLLLSLASAIYFSTRVARRNAMPVWTHLARRMILDLAIPLATGAFVCVALFHHNLAILIPSALLIFYGLALINASALTLEEIWYLGLAQIFLGLLSLLFLDNTLLIWAIGFGGLHIAYGMAMYLKYER